MRYLVTARLKPGQGKPLAEAIQSRSLGHGSVAGDEYVRNMEFARALDDQSIKWIETCFCLIPLAEERPYWETYFKLVKVQDAHSRNRCLDLNGTRPWACANCDCTAHLEQRANSWGKSFLQTLSAVKRTL